MKLNQIDKVKVELSEVAGALQTGQVDFMGGSWAGSAQRGRKIEKNLLVVKTSNHITNTADVKNKVSQVLQGIWIMDSRFTNGDNIVMNIHRGHKEQNSPQNGTSRANLHIKCEKIKA